MPYSRDREVFIPIVLPTDGAGLGGVGAMFAVFGAVVMFAVLVCIAVSCAHFSDGTSVAPTTPGTPGTCQLFCPATSSAASGGAR